MFRNYLSSVRGGGLIVFYMVQQSVQIVTAWTRASIPVEQWLQAASQEENWVVVWTQTMLGMTHEEVIDFMDWHQRAGRTITITEAMLQPPLADHIYRLK